MRRPWQDQQKIHWVQMYLLICRMSFALSTSKTPIFWSTIACDASTYQTPESITKIRWSYVWSITTDASTVVVFAIHFQILGPFHVWAVDDTISFLNLQWYLLEIQYYYHCKLVIETKSQDQIVFLPAISHNALRHGREKFVQFVTGRIFTSYIVLLS